MPHAPAMRLVDRFRLTQALLDIAGARSHLSYQLSEVLWCYA